jgi:hypothetical protein
MNLRRYDTYIVHYDNDAFIEKEEDINGEHTNANDALNIITVQKNRITELEEELKKPIYALYFGESCDGMGTPRHYMTTRDIAKVKEHCAMVEKSRPYGFGRIEKFEVQE